MNNRNFSLPRMEAESAETEKERLLRLEEQMNSLQEALTKLISVPAVNGYSNNSRTLEERAEAYNAASNSTFTPTSTVYSSDYQELLEENKKLKEENNRLNDLLSLTNKELGQYEHRISVFQPENSPFVMGQMNHNVMLQTIGTIVPSLRKQSYPISCTSCGKPIYTPDKAYDDTFPLSDKYGKDIICEDCFKKFVVPARVQRVATRLSAKRERG